MATMPEFYMTFARKKFFRIFFFLGGTAPCAPFSYAYNDDDYDDDDYDDILSAKKHSPKVD